MSRYGRVLALMMIGGLALMGCAPASVEEEVGPPTAQAEQQAQASFTAINQMIAMGKLDDAKAKLAADMPKFANTRVGRSFQSLSKELAVVGKDCPTDWGIEKWFQGEDAIDLASNAPTVVVFWESWFPHCRREVPKLQQMYDKYKGNGLQLIGLTRVNRSATEEAVQDLINQNSVSYPMAKENGAAANYFAVSGIPAAAVVKDGKVVWRGHPSRITEDMLQGWLAS